jgi:hypothetical protein
MQFTAPLWRTQGKREHELLRRELSTLRHEVGVERELKELRSQVAKAQRAVPQIPAIEMRLRSEATLAKLDIDQEVAELRKELKQARRLIVALQSREVKAASRDLGNEELEIEMEAHSGRARMVLRPALHPDAARTLREFAAKVIDGTVVQH